MLLSLRIVENGEFYTQDWGERINRNIEVIHIVAAGKEYDFLRRQMTIKEMSQRLEICTSFVPYKYICNTPPPPYYNFFL